MKMCRVHPIQNRASAFTLIELLVVVSIIALLIAVLLPSLKAARQRAREVVCGTQVRQIAQAITMYGNDNEGWFPMVVQSRGNVFRQTAATGSIRDYLGAPGKEPNSAASAKAGPLAVLLCPNRDPRIEEGYTNYSAGGSTGTTYRIVAARGNRAYTDYPLSTFRDDDHSWYGWINAGYSGSHASPIPREQMLYQLPKSAANNLGPSEQPMLSDSYDSTGNRSANFYGLNHYAPSSTVRHNHDTGVNTAFLDGHVQWTGADNLRYYVQFYSSASSSRVWW